MNDDKNGSEVQFLGDSSRKTYEFCILSETTNAIVGEKSKISNELFTDRKK